MLPTDFVTRTEQFLVSITFSQDDILKIIQSSLCKNLEIILSEWKKASVVPVHQKNDLQSSKSYRPISLLLLFGKMFERIICDDISSSSQLIT